MKGMVCSVVTVLILALAATAFAQDMEQIEQLKRLETSEKNAKNRSGIHASSDELRAELQQTVKAVASDRGESRSAASLDVHKNNYWLMEYKVVSLWHESVLCTSKIKTGSDGNPYIEVYNKYGDYGNIFRGSDYGSSYDYNMIFKLDSEYFAYDFYFFNVDANSISGIYYTKYLDGTYSSNYDLVGGSIRKYTCPPCQTEEENVYYYMPHLTGEDAGWNDILQADNNGSTTASFNVKLYSKGDIVYNATHKVFGHQYTSVDLKTLAGNADCGVITCSGDVTFRVAFENKSGGGVAEFPLNGDAASKISLCFNNTVTMVQWKGAAIMNPGNSSQNVTLTAYGNAQELGTTTVSIDAHAKIAGQHSQWFPAVSVGEIETIVVETSGSGVLTGIAIAGDMSNSKMLFAPAFAISK